MKISEIMTPNARCAAPDDNLTSAAELMRTLDVGALPVCDNDRLAGMITDRDIAIRAVAAGLDPRSTTVRDTMSKGLDYIFEDDDVADATSLMEKKHIRRLPVLNREKRLVGIVALADIATQASRDATVRATVAVSTP